MRLPRSGVSHYPLRITHYQETQCEPEERMRDGYLIIDSDLHMNEPEDLWARYLDEPYRKNPPRFYAGQQRPLTKSAEDKDNADIIRGMEVQGLAIPAFAKAQ